MKMSYHLSPSEEPRTFTLTAESEVEREELVRLRDMLRGRDDLAALIRFAREGMTAYELRQTRVPSERISDLAERWEKRVAEVAGSRNRIHDLVYGQAVCARELREFIAGLWTPVSEKLPDVQQVVQVRVLRPNDVEPWHWVGLVAYGMSFGGRPMPLEWRDPLRLDSEGRMEPLHGVTHWSRLGAA